MTTSATVLAGQSGDSVRIRPGEDEDVPAVAAIYDHHVRHGTASFETEPPSVQEMRRRRCELVSHGYPYLVAERRDEVVGYAYAGVYRARPAYRGTVENSVYLRSDMIGQRIGTSLLRALIGACEKLGFRQMIAVVGDSGNLASIRLHESCGFRNVGVFRDVGFKHDRWLDTVLLQRALGRGSSAPL